MEALLPATNVLEQAKLLATIRLDSHRHGCFKLIWLAANVAIEAGMPPEPPPVAVITMLSFESSVMFIPVSPTRCRSMPLLRSNVPLPGVLTRLSCLKARIALVCVFV